ncbi:unnamed protein product [Pocillopora meandrina]|uniref:Uncharacterized protein n=1 Tax=Pocillopora meandrina TaxID=46732 RepID=A0AAU9VNS0_9CNID|nr:unnamed protein product [Pocillopora meandrina]
MSVISWIKISLFSGKFIQFATMSSSDSSASDLYNVLFIATAGVKQDYFRPLHIDPAAIVYLSETRDLTITGYETCKRVQSVTCVASSLGNQFLFLLKSINILIAITAALGNAMVLVAPWKIS